VIERSPRAEYKRSKQNYDPTPPILQPVPFYEAGSATDVALSSGMGIRKPKNREKPEKPRNP
jgi:hypothetical protein